MLLHDILAVPAREHPDRVAVVCPDFAGASLTFGQLDGDSAALAAALGARGVSPGGRVAIVAHNRVEYVVALYGVPRSGRVLVPLNPRLHPREWAQQLARSGTELVLADPDLTSGLAEFWDGPVVAFDGPGWEALLDEGRAATSAGAPSDAVDALDAVGSASDADLAWLLFTSGSTGRPKGVRLTHRSLAAGMRTTLACRPVHDDTVFLTPFPLCHVAGAYQVPMHHMRGRPVVIVRKYDPAALPKLVEEHGVTSMSLAPTMIDALLAQDGVARLRGRVRSIGYGASAISPELLARTAEVLGCDLGQGFGSTELCGNAVFLTADDHRDPALLAAAGRPGPGVGLRILDDAWAELPTGTVGEICVRADQVCDGYWEDDDANAAAFRDGWFRTGDLGRLDADGYLFVVDRKKDIVISGGENVSAREVEGVLRGHAGVRDVAVIGVPDARWGERVCAVVVPTDPQDPPSEEALTALCRSRLAGFKVPRVVHFVDELPATGTGKVSKPALRERFAAGL
ncbi:class I adenylate-forming enzyme family protein [Yinghuangia seranimata]|uniref:class I adenylate-forming enzyme family protein n=1 Tax=Yinghuangia seranimata TaxID=408067 RepID=UPI00248CB238|nr:AMP-binding protein [Yinghuangia seranimata]MDI2125759.1 AMP-binding protein [Yinghuangia seranimata]